MSTKEYLIEKTDGIYKIEVPADWKVTFGPVVVPRSGNKSYGVSHQHSYALRFYETDTKQRAIFLNVISFVDNSIKMYKKSEVVKGKDRYVKDGVGNSVLVEQATVAHEWNEYNIGEEQ